MSVAIMSAQERQYTDRELGGSSGGVVGSIADEFNVTPTGQVSYEIPIPALPGTGGVTPKISICYNGSTKEGLAGYGFDLQGLSIIHRIPSNVFDDGIATAINFSNTDHFALDGCRLVKMSSVSMTEIEYRTEVGGDVKVMAHGNMLDPTSFTAYTKSGLVVEYRSSVELLGGSQPHSLFWLATKVSDRSGNYYTVTYEGDAAENDFRPSRIDYTGNDAAGLAPYASMRFSYYNRNTVPFAYIGGEKVSKKKVLTSISLYYGDTRVREFTLSYSNKDNHRLLQSIKETGSDLRHKNPTVFTWTEAGNLSLSNVEYNTTSYIHKATLATGDFNGDGKSDFIAVPQDKNAGWNGWKLFTSNGKGVAMASSGLWRLADIEIEEVITGDFNGDGLSDVVVKRSPNTGYHSLDLYIAKIDKDGRPSLDYHSTPLSIKADYTIHTVAMDGSGADNVLVLFSKSSKCRIYRQGFKDGQPIPLNGYAERIFTDNWDKVELGDFNGDGLTDILNLVDDGYRMICSDGCGTISQSATGSFPTKKHHVHTGDFNGDGKTDLLLTGWDGLPSGTTWSEWQIDYSIGDGRFERVYRTKPFEAKDVTLIVADLNGDGNDDFIAVNDKSTGIYLTKPSVYINNGDHSFVKTAQGDNMYALDKWRYYPGDFNGDGKTDILCTSDWKNSSWDGCQMYLMPESPNSLLSSITDGMGNKTEVSYGYMTDGSLCSIKREVKAPLSTFATAWPMVSSVSVPDGLGGKRATSYRYGTPIFYKGGRGFLCFSSFTQKDETDNTSQTVEYEVIEKVMAPVQKCARIYCGSRLLSEETAINSLIYQKSPYAGHIYRTVTAKSDARTYEYNSGIMTSEVLTDMEYDQYGQLVSSVMANDDLTVVSNNTYSNDPQTWTLGRLTKSTVTKTKGEHTSTKSASFAYDSKTGLLVSECVEPGNRQFGLNKTYTRDRFGNILASEEIPLDGTPSRKTTSTYDAKGRFIRSATDARGFSQKFEVDERLGVVLKSTDENGVSTEYSYDGFGNLIQTTDPLSKSVQTTGWAAGMSDAPVYSLYFTHTHTKGGAPSIEFFDCLGRSLRSVNVSFGGKKVYADVAYDRKGHVYKAYEPYFQGTTPYWTYYTYDDVGRMVSEVDAAANKSEVEYSGLTTITRDPKGNETARTIDASGNLIKSVDALGTSVEYEYDAENRCVAISAPRKEITMAYDLVGNRTDLDDPDLGHVHDTYNAFGELISHTDEYGTATYTYDNAGRVTKEERSDCVITTSYDNGWKGKIDKVACKGDIPSSRSYEYDAYGRVVSERTSIGRRSYVSTLRYSSDNRICEVEYPNGLAVVNAYDPESGMLASVSNKATGLVYWRLKGVNARGQIEEEDLGNGLTTKNQHDNRTGSLTRIITPGVQDWQYSYDPCGNLLSRKDNRRSMTETFTYDALGRLSTIDKNGTGVPTSILYDEAGNIVSSGLKGEYSYEEGSNRIAGIETGSSTIVKWDAIAYNSLGKVSSITTGGAHYRLSMSYGPDKTMVRRTRSFLDDTTEEYHPGRLYEELVSGMDVTDVCYIYAGPRLAAISQQTSMPASSNLYYVHLDHLGSIQAYTDRSGKLVRELSYTAWGQRRNPDTWTVSLTMHGTGIADCHGFCGHEHLDLYGLIDMGGRMYDPVVGRFISPDPYVQLPDHSQGFNRYSYCLNNPLSLVDPDGYSWLSRNWKSITASIVGIAVSAVTLGSGSGIGAVIIAGAAGGAASAVTGALLNGCNFGEIAKATFTGALFGAASGFLNFAAADENLLLSIFKHSFSQGWLEGVQGGNALHGFISGAASKGGGYLIDRYCSDVALMGQVAMNSALAGTLDAVGGGKFANGAITGAFTYLFNESLHKNQSDKKNSGGDTMKEAFGVALTLSALDGPYLIGDVVGTAVVGTAAVYTIGGYVVEVVQNVIEDAKERIFMVYVLKNPTTGQFYVGRTSGNGTIQQVFWNRYRNHHMKPSGFIPYKIESVAYGWKSRPAIRGREQQVIDFYGGIGHPRVANKIRGVAKMNVLGRAYHHQSNLYFGNLSKYTGY